MELSIQLIAFGRRNSKNIHENNLGVDRILNCLSSNGYDTKLKFIYTDESYETILNQFDNNANFYGLTLHPENVKLVYRLAQSLKEKNPNCTIFVGGIFPTWSANEVFYDCQYIDFVVLGHGDLPLLELFDKLRYGVTLQQGLEYSQHLLSKYSKCDVTPCYSDINKHKLPAREYLKSEDKTVACILGSHGCYGKCSFCTFPEIGSKVTQREPKNIFDEMLSLYKNEKIQFFYFLDSSIEGSSSKGKMRLKELCNIINNSGYKFSLRAFTCANSFMNNKEDIELLQLMKKAGFVNIFVGVEAGCDNDLRRLNKRSTKAQNIETLEVYEKCNFDVILGYIILNPYTSYDELVENYYFLANSKFSLFFNYINCIQIYYKTKIYHMLKEDNLLMENYSYKSRGFEYQCVDGITNKIFIYLKDKLMSSEIAALDFQFNNKLIHTYYILNVLDDVEDMYSQVSKVRSNINKLCAKYFYILFVDCDFEKCDELYDDFHQELIANYNNMDAINLRLTKRYLKERYRNVGTNNSNNE